MNSLVTTAPCAKKQKLYHVGRCMTTMKGGKCLSTNGPWGLTDLHSLWDDQQGCWPWKVCMWTWQKWITHCSHLSWRPWSIHVHQGVLKTINDGWGEGERGSRVPLYHNPWGGGHAAQSGSRAYWLRDEGRLCRRAQPICGERECCSQIRREYWSN